MYVVFGVSFLLLIFTYFTVKNHIFQNYFFGISAFVVILSLGFINTKWHQPDYDSTHYLHQKIAEKTKIQVVVKQVLKANAFQDNYIAEVRNINHQTANGEILLSVYKDSIAKKIEVDDKLILFTDLSNIYQSLNPYQFDYAEFMSKKKIYKQAQVNPEEVIFLSAEEKTLAGKAEKIRNTIHQNLVKSKFSSSQISLMEALLLGQRSRLSKETYTQFSEAGVVHVLAVSGLHVGVLLYFLMFLFKPLIYFPKGKIIRSVVLISLLWVYAYLVGMTPSILRAVTMFSFLSLGLFFKRKIFTLNMLCLSALVLLFINPNNILEIGFQLSYSAVLSILLFYKKIQAVFPFKHKFLQKISGFISVTLAAQLGVLPLSLFYFHQFPGLFIISNLLIVPFLGIILGMGVFVIVVSHFMQLPVFIVKIYGGILDLLQAVVNWVATKDDFLFKHIYFSPKMLILSIIIIGLAAVILHRKSKIAVFLLPLAIISLQLIYIYDFIELSKLKSFYIFHQNRNSVLGFQHGKNFQLITDFPKKKEFIFLEGLQNEMGINQMKYSTDLQNYYQLKDFSLQIIDSSGIWKLPAEIETKTVLLRQSPKINLDRVLDSLKPQQVIADGSNYKSYVKRWEKTCDDKEISFHYTGKEGAFIKTISAD